MTVGIEIGIGTGTEGENGTENRTEIEDESVQGHPQNIPHHGLHIGKRTASLATAALLNCLPSRSIFLPMVSHNSLVIIYCNDCLVPVEV